MQRKQQNRTPAEKSKGVLLVCVIGRRKFGCRILEEENLVVE